MPVRFDIDVSDEDAAYLAVVAHREGTTPERLLSDWLKDFFTGEPELVNARIEHFFGSKDEIGVVASHRAGKATTAKCDRLP